MKKLKIISKTRFFLKILFLILNLIIYYINFVFCNIYINIKKLEIFKILL